MQSASSIIKFSFHSLMSIMKLLTCFLTFPSTTDFLKYISFSQKFNIPTPFLYILLLLFHFSIQNIFDSYILSWYRLTCSARGIQRPSSSLKQFLNFLIPLFATFSSSSPQLNRFTKQVSLVQPRSYFLKISFLRPHQLYPSHTFPTSPYLLLVSYLKCFFP